jgi:hypothetical protein
METVCFSEMLVSTSKRVITTQKTSIKTKKSVGQVGKNYAFRTQL